MSSKTRQVSVKELDSKLNNLTTHFTEELNKFKGELKQKHAEDVDGEEISNDLLRRFEEFETSIKNNIKNLQSQIDIIRNNNDKLVKNMDYELQKQNSSKIIIYGCPEKNNENILTDIAKLFSEKLHVNVEKSEIYDCYRLGTLKTPKGNTTDKPRPRPIVIEFLTMWKRNEVFYQKSSLKGSQIVLSDVLTPVRFKLFQEAKKLFQRDCWVRNGKIIINKNNKLHQICDNEGLNNLK